MKKLIAGLGLSAAVLTGCDNSPETQPYAMSEEALRHHVSVLASDDFGGRAPATRGEELTVQYLVTAFGDAGLVPVAGDSFVQEVPLISIETQGAPALEIKGSDVNLSFGYRQDQVLWTRREASATDLKDSELVFVGYGINAPERNWNDYEGVDVTGKTVVMLINDPGFATQDDALFNGNSMTYYGRWGYKFDEAAKQGAAGAIIIHDTKPAAYPWATVDSSWTGPQFDTVRSDKGADLALMESWITLDAANELFDAAGLNREELSLAAQKPGFKAVPMNLSASTSFTSELKRVTSRNVAAMLPGSEAPDEAFIYMAHWDHLGTDPSINGDGIYNGALDNATGTGGLIELARTFATAGTAPKRSIIFLAVTAEEQGLLGSAYYGTNPLWPLSKTVAGLNMDGLNNYGPTSDVTIVGFGNSELDDIIGEAAATQNRTLVPDAEPEKGYFYRSDHFELAKYGVPMLYPGTGVTHKEKGRAFIEEKNADYLANKYHKPSDELTDEWNLEGGVEDLELYYLVGRKIIDTSIWPNWRDGTEFKAARDAQRAGQ